jgi:hypothetical protein
MTVAKVAVVVDRLPQRLSASAPQGARARKGKENTIRYRRADQMRSGRRRDRARRGRQQSLTAHVLANVEEKHE